MTPATATPDSHTPIRGCRGHRYGLTRACRGHRLRPDQGLPWAPARPDQGLPGAPARPDNSLPGDGGFGLPGTKGFVFAFVPGTGWGWVDVELGDPNKVLAFVLGFGWTWLPVAEAPTTKPVEPPPSEIDNTLPENPEAAPK